MFYPIYSRLPKFIHVLPCLLVFTEVYPCFTRLLVFTQVYPCFTPFTRVYPSLSMFYPVYSCLPKFIHVYPVHSCLPRFSHVLPRLLIFTQVQARSKGRGRGGSIPPPEIFRLELNSATKVEFFY